MRDRIKLTVSEDGDDIVFKVKKEEVETIKVNQYEAMLSHIRGQVIDSLSKKIQNEIYNDVMKAIDIKAITNGVTVGIIGNLSRTGEKERY